MHGKLLTRLGARNHPIRSGSVLPPLTRHLEFFTVPTQLISPSPPNPALKSSLPSPPSSGLRVFHHLRKQNRLVGKVHSHELG